MIVEIWYCLPAHWMINGTYMSGGWQSYQDWWSEGYGLVHYNHYVGCYVNDNISVFEANIGTRGTMNGATNSTNKYYYREFIFKNVNFRVNINWDLDILIVCIQYRFIKFNERI